MSLGVAWFGEARKIVGSHVWLCGYDGAAELR
jgi:hypothetical protein